MVITLIGYRGTGKSTIAFPLAERLGWTAVDADAELEKRAGRTIRQLFDADGEAEFRRLERETLVDLFKRNKLVIAAGGGAVVNPDTHRDARNAGPVVWLKASVKTIERRLLGDATTSERRPNLTSMGGRAEIESLLAQRTPIYESCASIVLETDRVHAETQALEVVPVDELVDILVKQLAPVVAEADA